MSMPLSFFGKLFLRNDEYGRYHETGVDTLLILKGRSSFLEKSMSLTQNVLSVSKNNHLGIYKN